MKNDLNNVDPVSCDNFADHVDPVDFVDPNIGTVSHLLAPAAPIVQLPHGMIRLAPMRTPDHPDPWLADHIIGFPLNIISHRGSRAFSVMVARREACAEREACSEQEAGLEQEAGEMHKAEFIQEADHDFETVTPYEATVLLDDSLIEVSYTVTKCAMIYRFTFPEPDVYHILFKANDTGYINIIEDECVITGQETIEGLNCYFYAKLDKGFSTSPAVNGCINYVVDVEPLMVEARIGFSYISVEQAEENMTLEIKDLTFEQVSSAGRSLWNDTLSKITVEGGTEKQRRIFYSSLWRCHERQICITENGQYYSAYDRQVHSDEERPFYVDDWLWDTYRGLHPLRLILDPKRESDILDSYAKMVRQGEGWAPVFPLVTGNKPVMLGNHCAAVALDAYMKGVKGFDIEALYGGLKKTAVEGSRIPWHIGPATEPDEVYLEKGYFPALKYGQKEWVPEVHWFERRQSVAVTLEHAYDDWCIAVLAEALGKKDDADYFYKRALNYRTLYNEETDLFAPRCADGNWIEPFDPGLSGGAGGRDYYAECNGYVWVWNVPHDMAGLMELFGGKERFLERLDQLFNQSLGTSKYEFLGQFPDSTGLIGQFPIGNEPGFLIPYLYIYAGAPWRTQKRVRQIMDIWFDDSPRGLCGDDDGGALTAWYVFNVMGFYPLCPGRPVYGIGSPLFEKTVISLGTGGEFTIIANNVSKQNKYIRSAVLNGKPLEKAWFEHSDLVAGGSLVLEMGNRPNKNWGSSPEAVPPSFSGQQI